MQLYQPSFLFLLILVPLLALGAWLASRQRQEAWQKLVAPRLRKKLAAPASPWARWLSLTCGLLAFSFLIICLAQPIAGEEESESFVKGRNMIIAVDASRSMLVRDVAPNRLNAAKAAVYELLDRFPNDRIGLLAFAGTASLQAPLTTDHNALRETLNQLDESNVPSGGSNLADAVNLATKTFRETGQNTHGLIVISDGELHEGELEDSASDAQRAGVFVVTIGIGSREGDFVPDPNESDGRFRDRGGRPVLSRLNPEPLNTLAASTNGLYLEGAGRDFTKKIDAIIDRLDAFEDEGRVQKTPIPRFQWFLIPAMILMTTSLLLRFLWTPARPKAVPAFRTILLLIGLNLFVTTPEASAWNHPLEGFFGTRALKKGDYEKAQRHFEKAAEKASDEKLARIRYGQGMARYQSGEYSLAGDAFSQALLSSQPKLQRDAHSQLANSLFHRGLAKSQEPEEGLENAISLLDDALNHYHSALELDPKHEPSLKNKKATEEALEQLKKQQEQQQQEEQEQEQQEGEDGDEEQEQEQNGEGEEGEESEEGENNQEGEQDEGEQGGEPDQEGEDGEDGEEEQEQDGQSGDQQEEEQDGESQESESEQEGKPNSANQQQQQQQDRPAPREDETSEEFARRILKENADFQQEALRKQGRQVTPTKDW